MSVESDLKTIKDDIARIQTRQKEIGETIAELSGKLDNVTEEFSTALEDSQKEIIAKISEIDTYMREVLEPNQQKIWHDGIGEILKELGALKETQEVEEDVSE